MSESGSVFARLGLVGSFAFIAGLCSGLSLHGPALEWQVMAVLASMAGAAVATTFRNKHHACSQSPTFGPHTVDKKAMSRGAAPACMWCGKPMKVRYE